MAGVSLSELRTKDVVNTRDGRRLGKVMDIEFSACDDCVQAIVVPGDFKIGGLFKGEKSGVVITTVSSGYGGKIKVMTGINANGEVSGVNILSMEETPGLGAKGKEDGFLRQYKGYDSPNLAVSKDGGEINALSGATITSRAITRAVNEAIEISKTYLFTVSDSDITAATGGKE